MEKRGIVYRLEGAYAWIAYVRESACGSDCASCKGCESVDMTTRVFNDVDARIGDIVALEADAPRMARLSNMFYLIPFGFFLVGVALAYAVGPIFSMHVEALAMVTGIVLLLVSGAILRRLDRTLGNEHTIQLRIIQRKDEE